MEELLNCYKDIEDEEKENLNETTEIIENFQKKQKINEHYSIKSNIYKIIK